MTWAKKATTTVSTKGQVILPKAIRDSKGGEPARNSSSKRREME